MSSRCGDPAAKEQSALGVKQERVTGCFRTEALGLDSVAIDDDLHARDCFHVALKSCLLPIGSSFLWLKKEDVGSHFALKPRHDPRQLAAARLRAGTTWMRQHDQRRPVLRSFDLRSSWPSPRQQAYATRCILVLEQDTQAKRHRGDPRDRERCRD